MPKGNAPRGKKTVLRTERMPDGSQIYARGKTTADKMRSIIKTTRLLRNAEGKAWEDVKRARSGTSEEHKAKLKRVKKATDAYHNVSRGVVQLSKDSELKRNAQKTVKKK